MPRTISANSIAKLATNLGTEPVTIIQVQWVAGGSRIAYADKDIAGAKGKILAVSGLENVVAVSGGGQSQQISVTLDDTDGSIKAIMNRHDVHKRACWVYQWFEGIPQTDKFLLFRGEISSPLVWDEGDRSIKFDVISKIEDTEVGFSIEEGDFPNPPAELIGKPWPLCFGTVINVPALRMQAIKQGILATGVGIKDFTLENRLELANKITCPLVFVGYRGTYENLTFNSLTIEPVYEPDNSCIKSRCEAIELLKLQISEQSAYEYSSFRVFGGENFPQDKTITLNINGGLFRGKFDGQMFNCTSRTHPQLDRRTGGVVKTDTQSVIESACPGVPAEDEIITSNDDEVTLSQRASKMTWDAFNSAESADFFWANAGSAVTLESDEEIIYIANLLPSTILRVAAWRELDGGRELLEVPDEYYTIRQTNYTGYTGVMEIVFDRPLSRRAPGWSDDIYVTLTSDVGPNTCEILEWFIETYTPYDIDSSSFNTVRSQIDNYPMHFPLLQRKNIINVLEEIAFQARCALWLTDDKFYIKYLAAEPTADDSVTENDVLPNTLRLEHTRTEDLVTKYVARWRKDYAIDTPNTLILRHNVRKYGTHEQDYEFYCFNILSLVRKSATFWLIRRSNTWRRAIFSTPMSKLKLEAFDTVALTLPDIGVGTIKGMVEKANYNSKDHTIDFEVWTPCKSGSETPYDFAWPANISETKIFPTLEEREFGLAGSGKEPNFSTIAPNGHPLSQTTGLIQGFSLACNGDTVTGSLANGQCRPDHGERRPTDTNDQKPSPNAPTGGNGGINTGTSPIAAGRGEGSNCCKAAEEARRIAEQAARDARAAAEAAARGGGKDPNDGNDDQKKDSLPKKCGGPCQATVKVQIGRTKLVVRQGAVAATGDAGASGKLAANDFLREDCYTFNSTVMAKNFAQSKIEEIRQKNANYRFSVGKEEEYNVNDTSPNLGLDENGNICREPDSSQWAQTGFTGGPVS